MATKIEAQTATEWWITTGVKSQNGRKVLGPFVSNTLALEVRSYVESVEGHHNYWVEGFRADGSIV